MRLRLLWKILLAYWITLIAVSVAIAVTISLQARHDWDPQLARFEQRIEREQAASAALRYGGQPALKQLLSTWPASERSILRVSYGLDGGPIVHLDERPPPKQHIPVWPLAIEFIAGLVFSAALAAYMTRPIDRLRGGFRRLAQGDLGVRLTPGMGSRRDEIADLAKDFDSMAERLQQLVAARDRLLHDVSHELRSPLARMSVAMGLARQNPERSSEALERIEGEGARLNTIVGDLLSLSRAEAGAAVEENYFDIAAMLEVICADARFEAQPRDVGVELAIAPPLSDPTQAPLVSGAPELIRRALENVVRNALRFSPSGTAVRVQARLADRGIVIEVRDHGPGADAAMRAAMFEPFVKGGDAAAGAGLGLAIARRALAAHGGHVEALSAPGGGLLVRMVLPPSRA